MRVITILILVALALSVLSPGAALCLQCGPDGEAIGMLNVCHKSISGISPDLPYISEYSFLPVPATLNEVSEIFNPSLNPLLMTFQEEHPPKA